MYQQAPDDQKLQEILKSSKTIAIVGVSDKSDRPSYGVAEWLIKNSHLDVYLVNPRVAELFGRMVYPSLEALPVAPDIVEALKVKAKVFWLQLGLEDEEVAKLAQAAGVISIQNRCTKIEYARLMH